MSVFKKKDKSDDKKKKNEEVEYKKESPQGSFQPASQSTSQNNLHSLASSVNNGGASGNNNSNTTNNNGASPTNSNGSTTPTYNHNNSTDEFERIKKEEEEKRKQVEAKKKEEEDRLKREQLEIERKRREEEIRRTNAANAANAANKEMSEQVEISSLEQMGKLDSSSTIHDIFGFFPNEVYNSYEKLQYFSRDLNTSVSHPEIVFIGPRSSGKSSLIESFIGKALNIVGNGNNLNGCSKRVLYLQFSNNFDCEIPKVTIKKDNSIKEFDHDIIVTIEQLNENLSKRNQQPQDTFLEEPIYVTIESRYTLNLTLIDTPGLVFGTESTTESSKIESIVGTLLRPSHRLIVAVESCSADWKTMSMGQYLKKIDPELSRSTFVFTKFFNTVRGFSNTRDINKYLSGTAPDIKPFFVTLPSFQVRASYSDSHRFQEKIYQAHKRDMHALEQLQYDKRYERSVGVLPLRRYLLNIVWKSYQDTIPRILKHLRAKRQIAESTLNDLQKQSASLDSTKLRSIASNYTVTFLQITEKLLSGTSEGNPSANGQTLDEEKSHQGDCGEWVDAYKEPIMIDPEEWNIPYWSSKLYGGQQLERLMSEFKAVCDNSKISEVKMDDIATASGINKLNNIPNYAWAASDLTSLISRDTFVPLIEQLCERAMYIMKRLTDIADKVIESRKKSRFSSITSGANGANGRLSGGHDEVAAFDQYPFFTHHVKNLYYDFVHRAAKGCKEKCMDEFYSSRTIYWELTEHPDSSLPANIRNDHHETKTAVCQLATKLFDSIRQRITKNVLLKLYNFFLVPMQTDLWNEIQSQITCLSNEQLEQLFEVQATREQLKEEEKKQQLILEKYSQIDEQFLKAASLFCRPLSNSTPSA